MNNPLILYPMFALASWTGLVLMLIPVVRVRAGRHRQIVVNDFKFGESPSVPPHVSIPNRNYMNLLEIPMLFYIVCLILYVTANTSQAAIYLAWAYVVLRIIHSLIHLTYNKVFHRLFVFAVSGVVLIALWVLAGAWLYSIT